MIDPVTTPERDEYGQWIHPALAAMIGDREGPEAGEFQRWCEDSAIEVCWALLGDELEETHPLWVRYFEDGDPNFRQWQPEPPDDSWAALAYYETEEGPAVMWFRPTGDGETDREEVSRHAQ